MEHFRDAEILRARTTEGEGRGNRMISVRLYGVVRNQMPEKIQVTWPIVHNDVLARMGSGCESFFWWVGGRGLKRN